MNALEYYKLPLNGGVFFDYKTAYELLQKVDVAELQADSSLEMLVDKLVLAIQARVEFLGMRQLHLTHIDTSVVTDALCWNYVTCIMEVEQALRFRADEAEHEKRYNERMAALELK